MTEQRKPNSPVVLRYIFRGESLKSGHVLLLSGTEDATQVSGTIILDALASDEANVPLHRTVLFFYSRAMEGWQKLRAEMLVPVNDAGRIEVMVEAPASPFAGDNCSRDNRLGSRAAAAVGDEDVTVVDGVSAGGYFGIGIYNSKSSENVGTLWRSAHMLNAKFIFTIGNRNTWEKSADTHKAWRSTPAFRYEDWGSFCASAPYQCEWVAVEMGGTPLHEFTHPERAVYVLGAEDAGLPASVVRACHHTVALEGVRASSYNVSVAGSILMYDRMRKIGSGVKKMRGIRSGSGRGDGAGGGTGGGTGGGAGSAGSTATASATAVSKPQPEVGQSEQQRQSRKHSHCGQQWVAHDRLGLFVPAVAMEMADASTPLPAAAAVDGPAPAIAYFATAEAQRWQQPWQAPTAELSEPAALATATASAAGDDSDGRGLQGYASWISACALRVAEPLVIRERYEHTGTRIWAGSWLHRSWALSNPQLFPPGSSVLELGAGCGLVGLTVATAHRHVHVTMSDFHGHCVGSDGGSVMHNLRLNAQRNAGMLADGGRGRVRVVELDWAKPTEPRLWFPLEDSRVPTSSASPPAPLCPPEPTDVLLACEVLYTEEGTKCFCATLAAVIRKPSGVGYIMNNSRRTDLDKFENGCAAYGLAVERLEVLEDAETAGGVLSTFAPPWDDCNLYMLLKVTWAAAAAAAVS